MSFSTAPGVHNACLLSRAEEKVHQNILELGQGDLHRGPVQVHSYVWDCTEITKKIVVLLSARITHVYFEGLNNWSSGRTALIN